MKKIIFSFAIAIFLVNFVFLNTASAEFKKTKIAVLDFQLQGEGYETSDMGKIVAEWLITALVKEGRFDVIERMLLKKVLDEQRLGVSGIIDESSASKLGRVLGAKIVITGSIMKFQNVMEVNARIIEVESSSIIAAENVKSTSAVKLEDLVVKMAEKIIKDFPLEGYIAQRKENRVLIDLG
ncbi:MAG: FlgO family outer membrane protein, partial [Nitrospirota bacterium]